MKKLLSIIFLLFITLQTGFSQGSYWNLVMNKLVPINSSWKLADSLITGTRFLLASDSTGDNGYVKRYYLGNYSPLAGSGSLVTTGILTSGGIGGSFTAISIAYIDTTSPGGVMSKERAEHQYAPRDTTKNLRIDVQAIYDSLRTHRADLDTLKSLIESILNPSAADTTIYLISGILGTDDFGNEGHIVPLKTIEALNTKLLQPGDKVRFRKGERYPGTLTINYSGTEENPITVESYNEGDPPVIFGGEDLDEKTWAQNGNIYACKPTGTVTVLYYNGTRQVLARAPNGDSVYCIHAATATSITASELQAASNYWTGVRVHARSNGYTDEWKICSSSTDSTLTVANWVYIPSVSDSIYVDGLYALLNAENEWAINGDSLYWMPPSGVNPNTVNVVGIVNDYGVTIAGNYVNVEGIDFQYQDKAAIYLNNSTSKHLTGNVISGNTIAFQNHFAIYSSDTSSSLSITDNTIRDATQYAIRLQRSNNDVIEGNTIRNIGMYLGYGRHVGYTDVACQSAISVYLGNRTQILRNNIDTVGYIGIHVMGTGIKIYQNIVDDALETLTEGGSIYCYSNSSCYTYADTIRANIILNSGQNLRWGMPSSATAYAIHIDGYSRSIVIDSNITSKPYNAALWPAYTTDSIKVTNNLFWRSVQVSGMTATSDVMMYIDTTLYNKGKMLEFTGNTIMPTYSNTAGALFRNYIIKGNFRPWIADNNIYCNPNPSYSVKVTVNDVDNSTSTNYSTLSSWQEYSDIDASSDTLFDTYPTSLPIDTLIYNATGSTVYIDLGAYTYRTPTGDTCRYLALTPFSGRILIHSTGVKALAANPVTGSTAVGRGSILPDNASTTTYCRWGEEEGSPTDSAEVRQGALSGTALQTIDATITGLSPSTVYYYDFNSYNSNGWRKSNTVSFTTGAYALKDSLHFYIAADEVSGTRQSAYYANNFALSAAALDTSIIGNDSIAVQFAGGTANYLTCAHSNYNIVGDTSFTIAFWYRKDSTKLNQSSTGLVTKGSSANGLGTFSCYDNSSGAILMRIVNATSSTAQCANGTIVNDGTYFVVAWYNTATDSVYIQVNNGAISQTVVTQVPAPRTDAWEIGHGGNLYVVAGSINRIAFWNGRNLSGEERKYLYNPETQKGRAFTDW